MDKRKRFKLNLEIFKDILKIFPRVQGQDFDALPIDEEIMSFLRERGDTGRSIHSMMLLLIICINLRGLLLLSLTKVYLERQLVLTSFVSQEHKFIEKNIIELYMKNQEHGRTILELVENGPLIWPTVEENGVIRIKKYVELSAAEKIQADCDMKATNIILQGTSMTNQERECKLYDAFDKFTHIKKESLHKYYLRFTQLINDMNIYNMKMEQFQVNTKFLNSLPPEWNSGLAILVFHLGDDLIACLNKALAFLTAVASSRQHTQPKRPKNASWYKDKAMLAEVLMANISNYGSDVILEKAQWIKPTLYAGIVISNKHVAMPVIDDEEILILEYVAVTPKNNVKKVRFVEPLTSSSNIKQVESCKTSDSNTPVLSPTRLKCSTSNCGSKPTSNKKNDRISQTPSRNMKNKVEAQPRNVNKKNCVVESIHNVNVKQSQLNAIFELICATFETHKPELKVYSRKPKNVKNVGSSKKSKIVESKNANHSEPNHTWGSNTSDIPSSSSLVMTGTVRFKKDHIARITRYGDYQLGNVTISRVYYVEGLGHNLFSVVDLTLFTWKARNDLLVVQIYVDDIIFASIHTAMCNEFTNMTTTKFKMSMMGQMSFFLGLQISQGPRGIFINQSKYAYEIVKKYGMLTSDSIDTPMVEKIKLDDDLHGKPVDAKQYHGMIRSLMHLTSNRPDLIYAVCLCARYQAKPIEKHLNAIKQIFRNLKGTINMALRYSKDTGMSLTTYADAHHAGCQDTRRSTSGSAQFLGDKVVSWSSKKQKRTAISNTKEQVENGIMELYFVRTEYQLADIFTKPLPRERFNFLIEKLSMRSMSLETLKRLVEKMDEITSFITPQQAKLNLELVPKEKRLEIRKCNGRLNPRKIQREPTFQVIPNALALTLCYTAFLIIADVPEEEIQTHSGNLQRYLPDLPTDINSLNDVVVDHMHQTWRTFAALINKSLCKTTTCLDKLHLSRVKILWGMYHQKDVYYVELLWEDFIYQIDNKSYKKQEKMYYPRFTKVIIHYFLTQDNTLSWRNKIEMHTSRDDYLINTLKFVSAKEETQIYGAILPECLTSLEIKETQVHQTYLVSTETPAGKSKRVKRPAKKSTETPARGVVIKETPEIPLTKKKEKVDVTRGKGIKILSQVALTEDAQFKEVRKKSMRDFHKTHPSGSGTVTKNALSVAKIKPSITSKGTSVKPGVPDVAEEESSENSDQEKDSDDDKTQSDNENESNLEHEADESESGSESDHDESEENKEDDCIKVNGVTDDALRLYLFPHSLTHHATAWFDRLPRNSINTFEQMAKMFLRNTFHLPWWRSSEMKSPTSINVRMNRYSKHGNVISFQLIDVLTTTCGTFMKRRPEECYDLIENMTAHHNDWDTSAQRSTVGQTQNVYAAGAYQGGNSYKPQGNHNLLSYRPDNYLGPPGFNQNQNRNHQNQNFQNQNKNQGNHHPQGNNQGRNQFFQGASHGQNPPPAYQALGYQANDDILKNMQTNMTSLKNSILELKNMFGQFMKMNTASSSGSETLPGPTIPTTSSSLPKVVERETEPIVAPIIEPVVPPVNAPKPNEKPSIPYPSRFHDQKLRDKANDQKEKFSKSSKI
uniref:Reverse transcriptase Ty1/copia-type domain-containing protein n=1 Tax=Tanacetum cinerariifolium TaxID=118510 RepID=A0A6L2LLC0_TANCI|nr:hypothetical protein [Tanacetum cinerariifolium]